MFEMVYGVFCGEEFYGYAYTFEGACEIAGGEECEIREIGIGDAEDLICG